MKPAPATQVACRQADAPGAALRATAPTRPWSASSARCSSPTASLRTRRHGASLAARRALHPQRLGRDRQLLRLGAAATAPSPAALGRPGPGSWSARRTATTTGSARREVHAPGWLGPARSETVALQGEAASARAAATGICQGSPMRAEIEACGPGALEQGPRRRSRTSPSASGRPIDRAAAGNRHRGDARAPLPGARP